MNRISVPQPDGFIRFLFFYHLAFALVFTWYLNQYGGDAIRYWNLTAETGHHPESWSDHFGTRSYFIQWLNYLPAKLLGLPFWIGNVLYALASFWALKILFSLVIQTFKIESNALFLVLLYLVFLLPNLHFWTAGIGKESLSLLGLAFFLKGSIDLKKGGYWLLLGILLSYLVRPLQGALLLGMALPIIWLDKGPASWLKLVLTPILVVAAWYMTQFLLYITHMDGIAPADIVGFSEEQFRFLDQFAAGSAIPMKEYPWWQKAWTLFFRPFWGEGGRFWPYMAILENSFSLLLFLTLPLWLIKRNWKNIPLWLLWALVYGLLLMGVYALTLNNLGIIMRMKSFFMIFFHLLAVMGIYNLKLRNI